MSDILTPDEFRWAIEVVENTGRHKCLVNHDAAQRARIAELEGKLAALQHIGTGAGLRILPIKE